MAKSSKSSKNSTKDESAASGIAAPFRAIGNQINKISAPVRESKVWKFLRRTVLRSPFRGYFVSSWRELREVTWPNRRTAWKLTMTVVLFSVFFAALVSALDYGFDNLAKRIFLQ